MGSTWQSLASGGGCRNGLCKKKPGAALMFKQTHPKRSPAQDNVNPTSGADSASVTIFNININLIF